MNSDFGVSAFGPADFVGSNKTISEKMSRSSSPPRFSCVSRTLLATPFAGLPRQPCPARLSARNVRHTTRRRFLPDQLDCRECPEATVHEGELPDPATVDRSLTDGLDVGTRADGYDPRHPADGRSAESVQGVQRRRQQSGNRTGTSLIA